MGRKLTTSKFITKATGVHGDTYDYSEVKYINGKMKVVIKCKKHGEFLQSPDNHISKRQGCPTCVGVKLKTTDKFINDAKEVHGETYDYSGVKYINGSMKVIIKCKEHGEFLQVPSSHLQGAGCPTCAGVKLKTTDKFIQDAKEVHGEIYEYSGVKYIRSNIKVFIKCKKHGEFLQTPGAHLQGAGCLVCAGNQLKTIDKFIQDAKEVHGEIYDYSEVKYIGSHTNVIIKCKEHGDFEQTPSSHLRGSGCPICTGKQLKTIDKFIQDAKDVHGDKYDYSEVKYIGSHTKVIIKCKEHGEFLQTPNNHLRGQDCPKCFGNYSKISLEWLNFIKINNNTIINVLSKSGEYRIPTTRYHVDGFCMETNTVYEFQGDKWHGNPNSPIFSQDEINPITKTTYRELYETTQTKKQKIIELGYKYVEMWEYDWRKARKAIIKIQKLWRQRLS
jgi:hypothetical protein